MVNTPGEDNQPASMDAPTDAATDAPMDEVAVVGALAEPTRRSLYEQVVEADDWVSRDQVADTAGLPRATAAHHLDRLVEAGLLEVTYRRLTDRTGPGAGRPAKLYRRAARDVIVTLPPRDYELAGELLARAVLRARAGKVEVLTAVHREAAAEGKHFAEEMRRRCGGDGEAAPDVRRDVVVEVLAEHGYEPVVEDGTVLLRNCPFHRLSTRHRELVCGMNVALLRSAVDAFGDTGLRARLDPREGYCCVTLSPG
jgi:predicted ArsR family transcriptional regulator